jgi:uroporphyrinogen decarboxylase
MTPHWPGLKNDNFLRALLRLPTDYTPLWLMRQAGRYLPEYNATRAKAGNFMALAQTPELACEVTLQPLDRYPLDAAILFSDILTVPDAMGLGLHFVQGEGPRFERTVRDEAAVHALPVPDPSQTLKYVTEAVSLIRKELNGRVPLIGFAGSPWTIACYMVEGQGSSDFHTIKKMMYQRPDLMHKLLATNAQATADYLKAQIVAGAQAIMLFDSWGGALADGAFQAFSLRYMKDVLDQLPAGREETDASGKKVMVPVPKIVFTKGGGLWLEELAQLPCDALGVDWTVNLGQARQRVGSQVAIQGNLDPVVLLAGPEQVRTEAKKVLDAWGKPANGSGHVFNLGHGISQFTPPENVGHLAESVHAYSRELRQR